MAGKNKSPIFLPAGASPLPHPWIQGGGWDENCEEKLSWLLPLTITERKAQLNFPDPGKRIVFIHFHFTSFRFFCLTFIGAIVFSFIIGEVGPRTGRPPPNLIVSFGKFRSLIPSSHRIFFFNFTERWAEKSDNSLISPLHTHNGATHAKWLSET